MNHEFFCCICGTADPELKHVRVFLNWFPDESETPRMDLVDPESQQDHGVVLCSGCICSMASKAMEEGLIEGVRNRQ